MDTKIKICEIAAKKMRKDALKMAFNAKSAHLGGGLSAIEMMAVLYKVIMNIEPKNPMCEHRDRLIFSKGHGALALYTGLNQAGFITDAELLTYKENDTFLYGHPSMNLNKGIEFSSGSLGQGLSLGVGTALALKLKNNFTSKVYVILGDGECNEGSIWEAAISAAHYKLDNLVVVVDNNGLQYDGSTDLIMSMGDFEQKWNSFGFFVQSIDGHNIKSLIEAFYAKSDKPKVIIANTIKGCGVSFMENQQQWHFNNFNQKQFDLAMLEQVEKND